MCADGLINGPIKDRINTDIELSLQYTSLQVISKQQLCFEMMMRQFKCLNSHIFSYHWSLSLLIRPLIGPLISPSAHIAVTSRNGLVDA